MVASLGAHSFWFTMAGVGILGGIGVGFAYVIPISIGMQWFPRHKGLVTGIIVAGFGGGAALVAQVATRLMVDAGFTPYQVLRLLGAVFAFVVASAGLLMRYPGEFEGKNAAASCRSPEESRRSPEKLNGRDVIRDPAFRLLYLAMFAGLAAGFAINANLRQLCQAITAETGAIAVAVYNNCKYCYILDYYP
jgi:OFA family oxalate/formate antiporter-like MFS transporter